MVVDLLLVIVVGLRYSRPCGESHAFERNFALASDKKTIHGAGGELLGTQQCVGTSGETATTSKEGSRRVNYPILTQGGSDNKYQYGAFTVS
jgi:hypothetical protein